ncbi:DUF2561 family protein [Mycolicibacterium wolinskyi]|uniref:DUF2561 family protein n=1 Tax=Mycolicibacterium wolinskyi TaxID=59750 RepID=UPI0039177333
MTGPNTELNNTDRILLGACAVAWLAALGAAVAAVVALVDLGRGHPQGEESADTPWLLYTVIGISVVVIVAAVPLLLRARAQADNRQPVRAPVRRPQPPSRYGFDRAAAAVEQVWLRFALSAACAIGVATAAVGLATYLMATDNDVAAWCLYGLAGLITVGMVALPILAVRQLDQLSA